MVLTFGVFVSILKKCSSQVTNQTIVSRLISSVDPNEHYLENRSASSVSRLMNCQLELPDPSRDAEALTDILRYIVDYRDPEKVLVHFQDNVVPIVDLEKRRTAMAALQAVISEDRNASDCRAETFEAEMGMTADEFVLAQSFDFARVLAGLFLYTVLIGHNRDGRATVQLIADPEFWEELHPGFMVIDSRGSKLDDVREILGLDTYFEKMRDKYGIVHTILPGLVFFSFDDIFVCSDIEMPRQGRERPQRISDATVTSLRCVAPRLILNALGGNGKSMMLLHLLFDGINRVEEINTVPLYICLRFYSAEGSNLTNYIVSQVQENWPQFDARILRALLRNAKAVLLLDGLDEMADDAFMKFQGDLQSFVRAFPETQIIMSSRPYTQWLNAIGGFERVRLCELTKAQALELVEKINYFPNEPNRQKKFCELVDTELYVTQRDFVGNPLLLTAMLMVYEQCANVPAQKHIFFEQVYNILTQQHDSLKGGFFRQYATGLRRDDLKRYLSEFAYHTYKNRDWMLTMDRCADIYDRLTCRRLEETPTNCADFMTDMVKNISVMYDEGGVYHFYQNTFQEYFCAWFFAHMTSSQLKTWAPFFEGSRDRVLNDNVFSMLYGMRDNDVEESFLLPHLRRAFKKRPEAEKYVKGRDDINGARARLLHGYWSYLLNEYPELAFQQDPGRDCAFLVNPKSVFVEFVLHNTRAATAIGGGLPQKSIFHEDLDGNAFPADDGVTEEVVYLVDGKTLSSVHDRETLIGLQDSGYRAEEISRRMRISVGALLVYPLACAETVAYMESPEFPLMKEYIALADHNQKLKSKRKMTKYVV